MNANEVSYGKKAIKIGECYREGWTAIKDQYWKFFAICLVAIVIGSAAPIAILMGPMMCGVYICILKKAEGGTVSFDDLFEGFHYFVESLIATFMMFVPMLVVIIPMYMLSLLVFIFAIPHTPHHSESNPGAMIIKIMLMISPFLLFVFAAILAISVAFAFAYPLIADKKMKAVEAVKLSIKAAGGNIGGLVGLFFINMLLGIIGMMFCYIGAFLIMPITYAAQVMAYRKVFPKEEA